MSHRRITKRRTAMAGAGVAALVIAGFSFQTANASTDDASSAPRTLSTAQAGKLASSLTKDLGKDAAGSYYDAKSKQLVVNVLDSSAAKTAEAAGAQARVVQHSLAQLKSAQSTLKQKATIPGTSWGVDPVSNKVVATADSTVKGAKLDQFKKVAKSLGSTVEVKQSKGQFKPYIAGGDEIAGGGVGCSLGFNVTVDGQPAFLTAGHCTEAASEWTDADGQELGTNVASEFPGTDYGLVQYTSDAPHPSEVDLYDGSTQAISGAGEATVGQDVTRSGFTSHVHSGTVNALDATVNYDTGETVEGLIDTDVCAEPGDSGGSLFSGDTAIGLTSGGSGDCSAGGETFFQPVTDALDALGAEIG
ncbi:S1 family peptidase [Streptomyces sp. NPDC050560]|uniref:S1 family peptidase n=1 Tax=Streptomyces sp. NPDC050560 TaxID=3365630 RepID=UPI00378BA18D